MLGLFMVIPVFMLLGRELEGATEFSLGVAIGIYGLSQALLQIPLGMLADRIGRKPVIIGGLVVFVLGSVVAALANSVEMVILGRFLQGSGAIAGAVMALVSDVTREESRTQAMAMVGMTIGLSFALALVAGPLLGGLWGLSGLFWLTAVLAALGIPLTLWVVPTPVRVVPNREAGPIQGDLVKVLRNRDLLRLDFGIFSLHLALTALFVVLPLTLAQNLGIAPERHWLLYLSVMGLGFVAMVPFIIIAEKRRRMRPIFLAAISLLTLSALGLYGAQSSLALFWIALFLFFMAFNLLEASLPSLISKQCPAGSRGSAMGIYSSSQFLGAFFGGVLGGAVAQNLGGGWVFLVVALVGGAWWLVARTMPAVRHTTSYVLKLKDMETRQAMMALEQLMGIQGVEDATLIPEERVAYLKVDRAILDEEALRALPWTASEEQASVGA